MLRVPPTRAQGVATIGKHSQGRFYSYLCLCATCAHDPVTSSPSCTNIYMYKLTIWTTKKTAEVRVHLATDHAGCWLEYNLCMLFFAQRPGDLCLFLRFTSLREVDKGCSEWESPVRAEYTRRPVYVCRCGTCHVVILQCQQ